MSGFFSRIFQRSEPVRLSPHQDKPFLEHLTLPHLEPSTVLNVPESYCACLFQEKLISAPLLRGEHFLTAEKIAPLQPTAPINILYLNRHQTPHRAWQLSHHLHDEQILQIHGEYHFHLSHPKAFFHHLLQFPQPTIESLDDWLAEQVNTLINIQNIPTEDILTYPERLSVFLQTQLTPLLHRQGLTLIGLTLTAKITAAIPISSSAPESSLTQHAKPIPATPKDEAPLLAREYYRVIGGRQMGPYSIAYLQTLIDQGTLEKNELLWKKGMPSWQKAEKFSELQWTETK